MNAALPRLGLIVALASLAACRTVGPDYALPEGSAFKRPETNAAFIDTKNPQVAANQALPDRWWSLYNDPVLDGLITQALRDNVELKAADAHLRRAAAVYEQALDAGGFEYEAEAGVSRAQLSAESFLQEHELPVINLADGKFAVSYQFDLFGKLKRGAEAARADEQSVAAARDLAQVSVVAQVADSYLEICHANHELHVAEHSLQLQQRSRTVTERLIAACHGPRQRPGGAAGGCTAAAACAALGGRLFAGRPAREDPGPAAGRRDRLCARPRPGAAVAGW